MRQSNGCSTLAPKSSAAKQWTATTHSNDEEAARSVFKYYVISGSLEDISFTTFYILKDCVTRHVENAAMQHVFRKLELKQLFHHI